jgi:DNA-directed RNA polymerase specialized sigma24 family protein
VSGPESKVLPASIAQDSARELSIDSLVADHYGFVWRVLRGFGLTPTDAEDATQQVFMIAARKLDAIDPQRARSFVYGAALRVANNARRGLRRRREVPDDDASSRLEPEERSPELPPPPPPPMHGDPRPSQARPPTYYSPPPSTPRRAMQSKAIMPSGG